MINAFSRCWRSVHNRLDRLLRSRAARSAAKQVIAQRICILGFGAIALVLAIKGWVRPVLSQDISALHLPLGIFTAAPDAATLLHGPRTIPPDSVGVILAAFVGISTIVLLFRPPWLATVAGLLVALSLAANVAVAVNHPALVEMLDSEYEQRQQMARTLNQADEDVMTVPTNCRVGLRAAPVGCQQRGDLERGWLYLLHGRWLVPWAALGVLLAAPGLLGRRLAILGCWSLLGLALVACWSGPRLLAEYHWLAAQQLEAQCRFLEARQALDRATGLAPQLKELERTWLLTGKLDYQLGQPSDFALFFRASQTVRDKEMPRGVTITQDLAWAITGQFDPRSGLGPPPSGFNLAFADGGNRPGVADYSERLALPRGPGHRGYLAARDREPREALQMFEELLARTSGSTGFASEKEPGPPGAGLELAVLEAPPSAVRNQTARLYTEFGLLNYWRPVLFTDSHPWVDRTYRERVLPAAQQAWLRAAALDASRRDCSLYLGIAQGRMDPRRPYLVEATLAPALDALGDHVMHAEILNTLADCYLHAGRINEARRLYALSYDTFCLPKYINFRAQSRLGGL